MLNSKPSVRGARPILIPFFPGPFSQLSSIVFGAKTRLDFIDSLRGVAVFLVFFTHATEILYADRSSSFGTFLLSLGNNLNFGRVGVILFFAISGFVIPYTLKKSHDYGLHEFFISRVMRLYPAFLFSVIAVVVTRSLLEGRFLSLPTILANFSMFPRLFGAEFATGLYWTLEVEAIFYLICALLFIARADKSALAFSLLAAAGLIGFRFAQPKFLLNLFSPNFQAETIFIFSFLSVMCWAAVARKWWDRHAIDPFSKIVVVAIPFYWCGVKLYDLGRAYGASNFIAMQEMVLGYALGIGIFIFCVFVRKIHWRPLVALGRVSYSFYLFHGSSIYLMSLAMGTLPAFPGRSHIFFILSFLLTVVVSTFMFVYVEEPAIAFGRRLAKRFRQHGGIAPPTTFDESIEAPRLRKARWPNFLMKKPAPAIAHQSDAETPAH